MGLTVERNLRRLGKLCVLAIFVFMSPSALQAEPDATLNVVVTVANLSAEGAGIDPRAKRLHAELKKQFRYSGISVSEIKKLRLGVDQVGSITLPTGRTLKLRPLVIEKRSALLAVEISGLVQTDLRLDAGQLIIIGAEDFRDGKLVVALEADH